MDEKKVSYVWALLIGLLAPLVQVILFYARFGRFNQDSSALDYVMFFVAGAIGGAIGIAMVNRSRTRAAKWIVAFTFLFATPLAIVGMAIGGVIGPVGVILFSDLTWAIITAVGFYTGRFLSRNA